MNKLGFLFIVIYFSLSVATVADVPKKGVKVPKNFKQLMDRISQTYSSGGLAISMQNRFIAVQQGLLTPSALSVKEINIPLILGRYSNTTERFTSQSFNKLLFTGPNSTGTMVEYYNEVSYGQLKLTGETYGWYSAPQTQSYYVGNDNGLGGGAAEFVKDLVTKADADVDFGQFDNDGPDGIPNSGDDDGYVDVVMIVHTGGGAETGDSNNIWSHRSRLGVGAFTTNDQSANGGYIKINDYIIQPEQYGNGSDNSPQISIGVFCHEFGHALGLPDLYDTKEPATSEGIGNWGLMASGSYGGDGNHPEKPSQMSAWSKEKLGWVNPIIVFQNKKSEQIKNVEQNAVIYKLWKDGAPGQQYFLIENREKIGFDKWLPQGGLAIWHIDNNQLTNQDVNHKLVDLEEADGLNDLDNLSDRGDAGDIYPGSSNNTTFNSNSNPNSKDYNNNNTKVSVNNISKIGELITADLNVSNIVSNIFTVYNDGDAVLNILNISANKNWLSVDKTNFSVQPGMSQPVNMNVEWTLFSGTQTSEINIVSNDPDPNNNTVIVNITAIPNTQPQTWSATISVSDSYNENNKITFGQAQNATDGIDVTLNESELPPVPPTGTFDVRFILPVNSFPASLKDYRPDTQTQATWRITFQPGSGGYPISFSWNPSELLSSGNFYLMDEITGSLVNVNMRDQNNYTLNNSNIKSLKIEYSQGLSKDILVNAGWNIISVPLAVVDMTKSSLFSTSISSAFAFNNGYTTATTLENGKGYWLKFGSDQSLQINGTPVTFTTITVVSGWNLMGLYDKPLLVNNITSNPSGIISSSFFGYNNGYFIPDTLKSGKGYWLKASQSGVLNISSATTSYTSIPLAAFSKGPFKLVNDSHLDWGRIIITDSKGKSSILYMGKDIGELNKYKLPPKPPAGVFDVRYGSNSYVENMGGVKEIEISTDSYPVSISISNIKGIRMYDKATGGTLIDKTLGEGGKMTITNKSITSLVLEEKLIPTVFSLEQNYPNPFNPITTIKYGLPENTRVKLTIYNTLGQRVEEIINEEQAAGYHKIIWNAGKYASGVYIYRLEAGRYSNAKKLIFMK